MNYPLTPNSVTNRPRDNARLLAEGGTLRPIKRPRVNRLIVGIAIGILGSLAYGVWQAVEKDFKDTQTPGIDRGPIKHTGPVLLLSAGHFLTSTNSGGLEWQPVELSVYSKKYHGRRTASGERYDHYKGSTGATTNLGKGRWALPKGSTWEIQYRLKRPAKGPLVIHGGQTAFWDADGTIWSTVTVRINDCGSYRPRKAPVWIDLNGYSWATLTRSKPSRVVGRMRRIK